MWRFFVSPLVTSIAVVVESTLYLCWYVTLRFGMMALFYKPIFSSSITPAMYLDAYPWVIMHYLVPKWSSLLSASLLLGLGLASYEVMLAKTGAKGRSLWALPLNIFWFGLYLFLLTAPLICAPIFWSQKTPNYSPAFAFFTPILLPWGGFIIVLLAGVYSVNAGQVFSPKAVVRRIRHGRFNNSDN